MNGQVRAVIDVGTNSVKLLVARTDGLRIEQLLDRRAEPNPRLGAGLYRNHKLQIRTMHAAAKAVRDLAAVAAPYSPVSLQAFATSAARDAVNCDTFVRLVREEAGLSLDVLSGRTEAEWIYRGVMSDPAVRADRLLVLGFGGGSTAAVVSNFGRIQYRSFNLGTVRLMELLGPGDPPSRNDRDRHQIYLSQIFSELVAPEIRSLMPANGKEFTLVATGGAVTSLSRMKTHSEGLSRADERTRWLTLSELSELSAQLWRLSHEDRKQVPGVPRGRHDVILPGLAIVEGAMKSLGFARLQVSRHGIRYGALLEANQTLLEEHSGNCIPRFEPPRQASAVLLRAQCRTSLGAT